MGSKVLAPSKQALHVTHLNFHRSSHFHPELAACEPSCAFVASTDEETV